MEQDRKLDDNKSCINFRRPRHGNPDVRYFGEYVMIITGLDALNGTPVLDIKPFIALP